MSKLPMPGLPLMRRLGLLAMLLMVSLLPKVASAACSFANGTTWSPVYFSPPASIYVPANAAAGTVLWSSGQVAPASTPQVNCTGNNTKGGIKNYISSQPTSGATLFPTNVPGLSYRLAHGNGTTYMVANNADTIDSGLWNFSVGTELQLVVTGPIANGAVLAAGQLGAWMFQGADPIQVFITQNQTVLRGPACTPDTTTTNVQLPTVYSAQFTNKGSTAGDTAFNLKLTCQAGLKLMIQIDGTTPTGVATSAGVVSNAAGGSVNVGVQIMYNTSTTITLGTPFSAGTTPAGLMLVPFTARYYQTTATKPTAGSVNATATYTLTYQ